MSISKKLMVQPVAGSVAPEGVDFDGTNDYLSKSTDLTGNADGKTFTFSAWVYAPIDGNTHVIYATNKTGTAGSGFRITYNNTSLGITGYSSTNTLILSAGIPRPAGNSWVHVLISVDLSSTATRYVYVNDVDVTSSVTWSTYVTTSNIDFTTNVRNVGAYYDNSLKMYGRLAHVYLDYTYRDLSNAANRRLFITDDLKPADNQASLSPILYLPMTDADTAHVNEGTGGNFTPNGTFATSQRGPNQYNCVASEFDGVADYLSSTGIGASDSKVFTISVNNVQIGTPVQHTLYAQDTSAQTMYLTFANGDIQLVMFSVPNTTTCLVATLTETYPLNYLLSCQISFDLANPSNRHFIVNGVDRTADVSWSTYVNTPCASTYNLFHIGRGGPATYNPHKTGEVYFDTTYTDLSTNNPFWDADANRPKPVRQVLEETGNTPLIAMPIEASNAGLNLGTGGNFTVNSGPYIGARGGSEYWARTYFNNNISSNRLVNTSVSHSMAASKTFSFFAAVKRTTVKAWLITFTDASNNPVMRIELENTAGTSNVVGWNSSGTLILNGDPDGGLDNDWNIVFVSIDMDSSANSYMIVNGTSKSTFATFTTSESIKFDVVSNCYLGSQTGADAAVVNQTAHGLYFTTDYIDFSQEANRLKFVDAFGYPIDLQPAIDAGDIPNPLIYMKFDDPSNLGLNSGTGGNFTVNGTVTAGADVQP